MKMESQEQYKYFAFISYNYKDTCWGKRVQRKLEGYRMPSTLCSEHGWKRKPIRPVFFAPTDIQPGGLTEELQERLKASRNLIVICSPNSAKSEWVGKEIEYFHSLGRTDNIHFFIVDGIPHSGNEDTECFNPIIEKLGLPEILGANIHEKTSRWPWVNRERAYVQLITKLLGVEFDSIWRRHKRIIIEKFLSIIFVLSLIYVFLLPYSLTVKMKDEKHNLPIPDNAELIINGVHYPLTTLDTTVIHNFTGLWKFKKVHIVFNGTYYKKNEKDISPQYIFKHNDFIKLKRDSTFAVYAGRVIYGEWQSIEGAKIQIEDKETYTDANGCFFIDFPIQEQTVSKTIMVSKVGFKTITRQVSPSNNIGFILVK